jgi:hypothetical protein
MELTQKQLFIYCAISVAKKITVRKAHEMHNKALSKRNEKNDDFVAEWADYYENGGLYNHADKFEVRKNFIQEILCNNAEANRAYIEAVCKDSFGVNYKAYTNEFYRKCVVKALKGAIEIEDVTDVKLDDNRCLKFSIITHSFFYTLNPFSGDAISTVYLDNPFEYVKITSMSLENTELTILGVLKLKQRKVK